MLTAKLNDGTIVLAKLYKGQPSPKTFANRTQACNAAAKVGGKVIVKGRPFYVAIEEVS